jgi:hypothetical protein
MDKFIDNYLEPIVIVLLTTLTVAACLWAHSFASEYENKRSELYSECITTDHDKFQCYLMIYGDK